MARRKSVDNDAIMVIMSTATRPLSVVIACYNELATIAQILRRVAEIPVVYEIIVVDDCSKDGTRDALKEILARWPSTKPPLHVVYQPDNKGKGAAVRAGLRKASG